MAVLASFAIAAVAQAASPTVSLTGIPGAESASSRATFTFLPSSTSSTVECRTDDGVFTSCLSPVTLTGLSIGRHVFEVRAVDAVEGPGTVAAFTWTVLAPPVTVASLRPPPSPKRVRVMAGDRLVRLTWQEPAASGSEVIVRAAAGRTSPRVVFRGVGTGTTLLGLRNGVSVHLSLTTVDEIGNVSREILLDATPMPPFVGSPANGARVKVPPLLRWSRFSDASYFNVQLYRGSRKVLSAWPVSTQLQIARGWIYEGDWQTLRPGVYTWYVWPGLRKRSDAQYAPLLGKQTFVVS